MTTLNYIQTVIEDINARRARIAELGGYLVEDDWDWHSPPAMMAIDFVEGVADALHKYQAELEQNAIRKAGRMGDLRVV